MHAFDEDLGRSARPTKERSGAEPGSPGALNGPAPRDAVGMLRLQRAVGNAGVVQLLASEEDPHGLRSVTGGGGSPLDAATRVQMESAIGADFSDVRIHTGGDADRSARSLGAHAYTAGNDVVFAEGRYDPASSDGQRTLAHELTHVVQQRSGPVDGELTDTGVKVSDPSDRFEQAAEANATRVVSGLGSDQGAAGTASAPAGVQREDVGADADPVQREGQPEEEEPVQGLFVQREGEEEEMT